MFVSGERAESFAKIIPVLLYGSRINPSMLISILLNLFFIFCCCLLVRKLLFFRSRLHHFCNNKVWEDILTESSVYENNNITVLFGDSQIAGWPVRPFFGVLPIKNRGKNGDLATNAIDRFKNEVALTKCHKVLILIGSNDIAHGKTIDNIIQSIKEMIELARVNDIKPIVGSILPVSRRRNSVRPRGTIIDLNNKLSDICKDERVDFIDFFSKLRDADDYLDLTYSEDGLHINLKGYFALSRMVFPLVADGDA